MIDTEVTGKDAYFRIGALLEVVDTKRDGFIDLEELSAATRALGLGDISIQRLQNSFRFHDRKRDGKIPTETFAAVMKRKAMQSPDATLRDLFKEAVLLSRNEKSSTFELETYNELKDEEWECNTLEEMLKKDLLVDKPLRAEAMHLTGKDAHQQINALVASMDYNKDGMLQYQDVLRATKKHDLGVSETQVSLMFNELDDERKGAISTKDLAAFLRHKVTQNPNYTLKEVFRMMMTKRRRQSLSHALGEDRLRQELYKEHLTGKDAVARVEELLKSFDANEDGFLEYNDLLKCIVAMGMSFQPKQIKALFNDLDNGSGMIYIQDFASVLRRKALRNAELTLGQIMEVTIKQHRRESVAMAITDNKTRVVQRTKYSKGNVAFDQVRTVINSFNTKHDGYLEKKDIYHAAKMMDFEVNAAQLDKMFEDQAEDGVKLAQEKFAAFVRHQCLCDLRVPLHLVFENTIDSYDVLKARDSVKANVHRILIETFEDVEGNGAHERVMHVLEYFDENCDGQLAFKDLIRLALSVGIQSPDPSSIKRLMKALDTGNNTVPVINLARILRRRCIVESEKMMKTVIIELLRDPENAPKRQVLSPTLETLSSPDSREYGSVALGLNSSESASDHEVPREFIDPNLSEQHDSEKIDPNEQVTDDLFTIAPTASRGEANDDQYESFQLRRENRALRDENEQLKMQLEAVRKERDSSMDQRDQQQKIYEDELAQIRKQMSEQESKFLNQIQVLETDAMKASDEFRPRLGDEGRRLKQLEDQQKLVYERHIEVVQVLKDNAARSKETFQKELEIHKSTIQELVESKTKVREFFDIWTNQMQQRQQEELEERDRERLELLKKEQAHIEEIEKLKEKLKNLRPEEESKDNSSQRRDESKRADLAEYRAKKLEKDLKAVQKRLNQTSEEKAELESKVIGISNHLFRLLKLKPR